MEDTEPRTVDWWHSHANNVMNERPVRFDLFVRTLGAPAGSHGRQAAVLDRLDRLDQRDVVDSTRVQVWGDSICVSECCSNHPTIRSLRDRIASFRAWGQEKPDVDMGFERRTIDNSITDERFEVVDLPTMCLAVYVDSYLEGIFPVSIGEETWTVPDYLNWFEQTRGIADRTMVADA